MWKDDLIKEYEDIMVELALSSAMELEGEALMAEAVCYPNTLTREQARKNIDAIYKRAGVKQRKDWKSRVLSKGVPVFYRVALAVCMVFILVNVTSVKVDAERGSFWDFVQKIRTEFALVGKESKRLDDMKNDALVEDSISFSLTGGYFPTYIPHGFVMTSFKNEIDQTIIDYSDGNNSCIVFLQIAPEIFSYEDSENSKLVTQQQIAGDTALISEKNEITTITWKKQEIVLQLVGIKVDTELLIKIAESIEKFPNINSN